MRGLLPVSSWHPGLAGGAAPPTPTPPLSLGGTPPDLVAGEAFSFDLTVIGGAGPYTPSSDDKPAWLNIAFVEPNIIRFSGTAPTL